MDHHVVTISNPKARKGKAKVFARKARRLQKSHTETMSFYESRSVEEVSDIISDIEYRFFRKGDKPDLHFVMISGDGGYQILVNSVATHPITDHFDQHPTGLIVPWGITLTPSGHGTRNVLAGFAEISPGKVLKNLERLAIEGCDSYTHVQALKVDDSEIEKYGFMFTTGPTLRKGQQLYHDFGAGFNGLARVITKSVLSFLPLIGRIPALSHHYKDIFEDREKTPARFDDLQGNIEYGGFVAAAENFSNGGLHIWQKRAKKINIAYGGVGGLLEGLSILYRLATSKPLETDNITSGFVDSFILEKAQWYSLDDEPHEPSGPINVSRAGAVLIPRVLTRGY